MPEDAGQQIPVHLGLFGHGQRMVTVPRRMNGWTPLQKGPVKPATWNL